MQGSGEHLRTNHLTFSGPVRLPGVTLVAGTYVFERVEATNPNVIAVRSGDRARVYFMGNTIPAERPAGLARGRLVTLGEAPRGTVPPIEAWYPEGDPTGTPSSTGIAEPWGRGAGRRAGTSPAAAARRAQRQSPAATNAAQ